VAAPEFRHIAWSRSDDVAIVRFRFGRRLDLVEYAEIDRELRTVADTQGVKSVLLNLDALDHFPSRLLGTFLALAKRLSSEGRTLAVCRLRPELLRIFQLCKADALIETYASEEEARAALGA